MNKMQVVSVPLCFDWIAFGLAIRQCRDECELTLYQVAALCDISNSAVADIEQATHGNALISTVLVLANLFDLDIRVYFILSDTREKFRMRKKRQDANRPKFNKNKIRAKIRGYNG